jgi:hypothetical protein
MNEREQEREREREKERERGGGRRRVIPVITTKRAESDGSAPVNAAPDKASGVVMHRVNGARHTGAPPAPRPASRARVAEE